MENLKGYIKIARPDHWIKQLFILPGMVFAVVAAKVQLGASHIWPMVLTFFATCCIASANYVINEWLDAKYDRFHPTKKNRPVVGGGLKFGWVMAEYAVLAALGFVLALLVNFPVFLMCLWLFIMGILYNVRPFRTKDVPYLDVISESLNNAIRLMIGWFCITASFLPPVSIVLGYWLGGAFLMAMKRFSEYRMIADKETAGLYRKSFRYYDDRKLLIFAFFCAMLSVFFCGIFMLKYRIELLIAIPLICGLFCYYTSISYKEDSSAQKPEKLYREKGLMAYIFLLIGVVIVLCLVDIPALQWFLSTIPIGL